VGPRRLEHSGENNLCSVVVYVCYVEHWQAAINGSIVNDRRPYMQAHRMNVLACLRAEAETVVSAPTCSASAANG
jgi:hypothetical protein